MKDASSITSALFLSGGEDLPDHALRRRRRQGVQWWVQTSGRGDVIAVFVQRKNYLLTLRIELV